MDYCKLLLNLEAAQDPCGPTERIVAAGRLARLLSALSPMQHFDAQGTPTAEDGHGDQCDDVEGSESWPEVPAPSRLEHWETVVTRTAEVSVEEFLDAQAIFVDRLAASGRMLLQVPAVPEAIAHAFELREQAESLSVGVRTAFPRLQFEDLAEEASEPKLPALRAAADDFDRALKLFDDSVQAPAESETMWALSPSDTADPIDLHIGAWLARQRNGEGEPGREHSLWRLTIAVLGAREIASSWRQVTVPIEADLWSQEFLNHLATLPAPPDALLNTFPLLLRALVAGQVRVASWASGGGDESGTGTSLRVSSANDASHAISGGPTLEAVAALFPGMKHSEVDAGSSEPLELLAVISHAPTCDECRALLKGRDVWLEIASSHAIRWMGTKFETIWRAIRDEVRCREPQELVSSPNWLHALERVPPSEASAEFPARVPRKFHALEIADRKYPLETGDDGYVVVVGLLPAEFSEILEAECRTHGEVSLWDTTGETRLVCKATELRVADRPAPMRLAARTAPKLSNGGKKQPQLRFVGTFGSVPARLFSNGALLLLRTDDD